MSEFNPIKEIDRKELEEIIAREECPVLVVFHASWLATGSMLGDILARVSEEFEPTEMVFFQVDIDRSADTVEQYGITTLPTTLIFCEGEVIDHFTGVMNINKLRERLHALVGDNHS